MWCGDGIEFIRSALFLRGHNTKVQAIAYMPPVLAGVVWAYRGACLQALPWRHCNGTARFVVTHR